MDTTSRRSRTAKLYWNEGGAIACLEHAPYRGTDTWVWGRWRPITAPEAEEFARDVGRAPECETCAAVARREAERS